MRLGSGDWRSREAEGARTPMCVRRLAALVRDFGEDTRGMAAVIFALVFAVILFSAALALDFARGSAELTRQQWALDVAALAAAQHLGTEDQDTTGPARAHAFFEANQRPGSPSRLASVALDSDAGTVTASSQGSLATTLLQSFGKTHLHLGASTRVVRGDQTLEVALVLDNSGSMAGTYIDDLKTAAKNLSGIMFAGAENTEKVRIGVVPFAGSVNIGPRFRGEDILDNDGLSPVHFENFAASRTRFQLFDDMGASWNGCVEVRPGTHAFTDTVPSSDQPETLFVPMFAPDEPDRDNNGGQSFSNSYLVDDGGACTPQPTYCTRYDRRGNCKQTAKQAIEPAAAQSRICKYAGQAPGGGGSPNLNCQTQPLLPLTSDPVAVESSIEAMVASGFTNIGEGMMWGWRVLSPGVPFTEGRDYGAGGNRKILVLMTDGQNTYQAQSNMNKSHYNAYGFGRKGRLGDSYDSGSYQAKMDANLVQACSNARAAGISIYTIAFRLESSPATQQLLASCASERANIFVAADGATLVQVFQEIGQRLSKLRVAG